MNYEELKEEVRDARRALDSKCEETMERLQQMQGFTRVLEAAEQALDENAGLREEVKELREQKDREIDNLREEVEQKDKEISNLKRQLLEARNEHLESERQHLEAEVQAKPMEIHNHFESGSSSQVFNDKVNGKFIRKQKDENKKKKRWKKIVRKML